MRLSEFILTHRQQIISEWIVFARSCCPAAATTDLPMLHDHVTQMLEAIAADLNTTQSKLQQTEKSTGKSDANPSPDTPDSAAQAHGAGRAENGFSPVQMVAEFRALRATVVRLWLETAGELALTDFRDLIRFNEAIDQALAESTARFTDELDRSKGMFLAMLGHDLRTPLGAIIGAAQVMVNTHELTEIPLGMASVVLSSGARMNTLIGDLLDFTRSRLGSGIPIVRADMDLVDVCRQTIKEIAAANPKRLVNLNTSGELHGQWDAARVGQALSNVIGNADQYGADNTSVNVTVRGGIDEAELVIQNWGPVVPSNELNKIFHPMYRIDGDKPDVPRENLGLGLYIAERIVAAHGGTITVDSSEHRGTTFTLHFPRIHSEVVVQ